MRNAMATGWYDTTVLNKTILRDLGYFEKKPIQKGNYLERGLTTSFLCVILEEKITQSCKCLTKCLTNGKQKRLTNW